MLTFNVLIACILCAIIAAIVTVRAIIRRRWFSALLGYCSIGFFLIALPFKIGMHAMTWWGVLFLSVVWPVWLGQALGYNMTEWFPPQFWSWMFDV